MIQKFIFHLLIHEKRTLNSELLTELYNKSGEVEVQINLSRFSLCHILIAKNLLACPISLLQRSYQDSATESKRSDCNQRVCYIFRSVVIEVA